MTNALIAIAIIYLAPGFILALSADLLDGQDYPLRERFGDVLFALFCWPWIIAALWRNAWERFK